MSKTVRSIAIFGSVARSSVDTHSDKDVLIVSDDACWRRRTARAWSSDGWSVAAYAPAHLESMYKAGSLFLQHLRHEALVREDQGGWLRNLLDQAVPKYSYADDLAKSSTLFAPLYHLDDSPLERLFAADVAYVYLRNAAIFMNADDRRYVFAYPDLVGSLVSRFEFDDATAKAIHRLRELKTAYRGRNFRPDADPVSRWVTICETIARQTTRPEVLFDQSSGYSFLRDIERLLLQTWPIERLDSGNVPKVVVRAWKVATSPRDYRWDVRRSEKLLASVEPYLKHRERLQLPSFHASRQLAVPERNR